jgi:hypothetical protein
MTTRIGEAGMKNDQPYASVEEQRATLPTAGFAGVEQIMLKDGPVPHGTS